MIDTHQTQTVAGCGRSRGVGRGTGKEEKGGRVGEDGVGKEVLIYSGRTGAGGETVDMVLGECVCLCWCV